ncbi:aromatic ring-hydroxylating dioxygenase subunit alpha [Iamia sp. SCSIO 61187]|uniref:aromatic ring-hydroxylating oxygenase subunit alpha n=1 Tax=Iamia sp. SCSIO 61187 TaxID=2722752 RepID=UPI001C6349CE|nr:aromatic ring-hydroxylating dioxygenase subunit alpha [Iamia sp. SCSIO 61187]
MTAVEAAPVGAPSAPDRRRVPALGNTDPALRAAWHPVLRLADLGDEPVAVRLLGEAWVVARLDGEVVVLADRCPHRLAPLSAGSVDRTGETDVLRCGYHGWCFDGGGTCTTIPALGPDARLPPRSAATTPAAVATHLGLVWVAPDAPRTPLPPDPLADDDRAAFLAGDLPTITCRAGAGLLVDNFLDMAHFPYVHAATIGTDEDPVVDPPVVEREGDAAMVVRSSHRFPNREDPEVVAGRRPLLQTRHVTYRYTAPFACSLRIDYEEAGGSNVITFFVQPVDDETCTIHTSVARDDIDHDPGRLAAAVAFEEGVVAEDLALQSAFVELALPLDLTAEVHTRADRVTVELRRILADLVGA